MVCRRAWVAVILGFSLLTVGSGCASKDKVPESRTLILDGTALRDEGFKTSNPKKLAKGQKMIEKGERLREESLRGM